MRGKGWAPSINHARLERLNAVIKMREEQKLSFREIGRTLGVSYGAVRRDYQRHLECEARTSFSGRTFSYRHSGELYRRRRRQRWYGKGGKQSAMTTRREKAVEAHRRGATTREIATSLGVSAATIVRDLKRALEQELGVTFGVSDRL